MDTRSEQPVKIVIDRRAKPGAQDALEQWVKEIMESAAAVPSLQGSSVLTTGGGEYFILLRFASQDDLERWRESREVVEIFRRGHAYATVPEEPVVRTGMETWFTIPGVPAPRMAPPKWKMALVTWSALVPQVLALGLVLPTRLPLLAKVSISTAIPVILLTWVIMPRLTRLLFTWLYAPNAQR
jgi:uncharacterized protein